MVEHKELKCYRISQIELKFSVFTLQVQTLAQVYQNRQAKKYLLIFPKFWKPPHKALLFSNVIWKVICKILLVWAISSV